MELSEEVDDICRKGNDSRCSDEENRIIDCQIYLVNGIYMGGDKNNYNSGDSSTMTISKLLKLFSVQADVSRFLRKNRKDLKRVGCLLIF